VNGMVQKCSYCKHFGASVSCKASDKFFHFPCASASGAFLSLSTLTMVSTEYLEHISRYGKSLRKKILLV